MSHLEILLLIWLLLSVLFLIAAWAVHGDNSKEIAACKRAAQELVLQRDIIEERLEDENKYLRERIEKLNRRLVDKVFEGKEVA